MDLRRTAVFIRPYIGSCPTRTRVTLEIGRRVVVRIASIDARRSRGQVEVVVGRIEPQGIDGNVVRTGGEVSIIPASVIPYIIIVTDRNSEKKRYSALYP